ncbi:MAG: LytR/AlgR family response regulator transcription factor [Flavobacteriaceae bacterium]
MKLNYVILDPHETERIRTRQRLNEIDKLNLAGEFSNFNELKNFLQYESADIIIVDPSLDNEKIFNCIERQKLQKKVIFTSKKLKHAVKGFEMGILDFIHKPINISRFNVTLNRIEKENLSTINTNQKSKQSIEVKHNLKTEKIILSSIQWIEAMGDYVKIVTPKKNYIVLSSMKKIQERIPEKHFFRCHKSYIINIDKVESFSQTMIFLDKSSIPLSRSKKKIFQNLWVNH